METQKDDSKNVKRWNKKSIGLLVASIAFLLIVIALSSGGDKPEQPAKQKPEHSKITASVMAEEFVKGQLKSPGSAKFPWYTDDMVKDMGDGRYTYTSYVDSQNSFGALVRNNFTCTVKYVGNDKWICENLAIK